ncbi:restriction endonuclease [bacterium]|nr:MAG: restriction endonuclease [bacterium]
MSYRGKAKDIKEIINAYEFLIKGIEADAQYSKDRAYGGIIRAGKGKLVESIAKSLVEIAWKDMKKDIDRLSFSKKAVKIPINRDYIDKIKSPEIKSYIKENITDYYYDLKTDIHVHIDDKFSLAIECKAYTENAMLKRILVDFTLLKQVHPDLKFALIQLESQLGGDYCELKDITYGSTSTHTLLSYFDVELNIITLLTGERKVKKPIHKHRYYKSLRESSLIKALDTIKGLLKS